MEKTKKLKNFDKKKKREREETKGITLIALVITIIVLLILAAVSIATLTGENGILVKAEKGRDETERAKIIENAKIAVIEVQTGNEGKITKEQFKGVLDEHFDNTIEEDDLPDNMKDSDLTVASKDGKYDDILVSEVYDGILEQGLPSRKGLKVGDHVDYKPEEVLDGYSTDLDEAHGLGEKGTLYQEDCDWRILRIYDDGKIDLMAKANGLRLRNYAGYNYGVDILNNVCKTLYSNNKIGAIARSIDINDVEFWLTEEGKKEKSDYLSSGGVKYGETKKYTSTYNRYPNLYQYEIGAGIGREANITGLNPSDIINEKFSLTGSNPYSSTSEYLIATQTAYKVNQEKFGDGGFYLYLELSAPNDIGYLATRGVSCESNQVDFGLMKFDSNGLSLHKLAGSDGPVMDYVKHEYICPIVTLGPEVRLEIEDGGERTPHKIKDLE